MTANRGMLKATDEAFSADEDDDSSPPDQDTPTSGKYRMRDWKRLGAAIVAYLIFLVFIILTIDKSPSSFALPIGTTIFIFWMIAHSLGTVLDLDNKQLRYPSFIIRRRVPLFEIRDANAQVIYRTFLSSLVTVLNNGARNPPTRQYAVNISGEFGTHQIRFASRKRRDQFLSLLRRFVPGIRITRWSGWD
jgi:hypothetical protein